jgi:centromeric protein E
VVRNLSWVIVQDYTECIDLLKLGEVNRSYAQTTMNHQSSRSHTVYRLFIEAMCKQTEEPDYGFTAVLNFVDLAGSERANVHELPRNFEK